MKKLQFVLLAVLFAAGLSAFTSPKLNDVFYKNPNEETLYPTTAEACDGHVDPCIRPIPELGGASRPLFHADGSPYKDN
jgi:hypothetical protein